MKRTTLNMMLLFMLAKLLGFARQAVLGYYYGASAISDVYVTAMTVPELLFAVIASAIVYVFIPQYTKISETKGEKQAKQFMGQVLGIIILLSLMVACAVLLFSPWLIKLFAVGYKGEKLALAANFLRLTIWLVLFLGVSNVLQSYLQIKRSFMVTAIAPLPFNIILIITIILSAKASFSWILYLLPVGILLGKLSELAILYPSARSNGYDNELSLKLNNPELKEMLILMLPIFLGSSADQINLMIDRTIASSLSDGAVSILTYAALIKNFFEGIFVTAIVSVSFPDMARRSMQNDTHGLKSELQGTINMIALLMIPATLGTLVLAQPVVSMLYGRGEFSAVDVSITAQALQFYALGLLGAGLRVVLSRTFYAFQDNVTPLKNAVVAVGLNIVLNLLLSRYMGVVGLALASSISVTFCAILLVGALRRKLGPLGIRHFLLTSLKSLGAALVMLVLVRAVYQGLKPLISLSPALALSIVIGVLVYFVCAYVLKIRELDDLMGALKAKLQAIRRKNAKP